MRVKESAISKRLRRAAKDAYEGDAALMEQAADMVDRLVNTLDTISCWADSPEEYDEDSKDIQAMAMAAMNLANHVDIGLTR